MGRFRAACVVGVTALVACVSAKPFISGPATVNLGTPITITYDISDGIDGRTVTASSGGNQGSGKFLSKTGNDWIGLFPKGQCINENNNQDKHKCYVHWFHIPREASSGSLTFEASHYKNAGEYEARYFYGDDPTDPTVTDAASWVGQGWVCNTWYDSTSDSYLDTYDPNSGFEGVPTVAGLSLSQCQCDTRASSPQNIQVCTDSLVTQQSDCTGQYWGYGRSWDTGTRRKACNDAATLLGTCATGTSPADTLASCKVSCANDHLTGPTHTAKCKYISWDGTTGKKYADCATKDDLAYTVFTLTADSSYSWQPRVWATKSVTPGICAKYRAACGRCILDAVAYSNTVLVTGSSGTTDYQDMSSIPGFEIGF